MGIGVVTGFTGREHITPADMKSLNAAIVGGGNYIMKVGKKFAATMQTANKMRILDGYGMMGGTQYGMPAGEYEDVTIDNGTQGMNRRDLVVARYERAASTGVESVTLRVIKGTPSSSAAADPAYATGDILGGSAACEMPLYRVSLAGITVATPVKMFTEFTPCQDAWDSISSVKMGMWDVVKRPDGVAICKARISLSLDLSTSYENNVKFGQIPSYTYPPGLFATPPNVQFFIEPNDHTMWQASHNPGTAQATPPLRMLTFNPGIVPVVINIRAEG